MIISRIKDQKGLMMIAILKKWLKNISITTTTSKNTTAYIVKPVMTFTNEDIINEATEFIKKWEGFSAIPYKDIAGIRTIGYGTVIR